MKGSISKLNLALNVAILIIMSGSVNASIVYTEDNRTVQHRYDNYRFTELSYNNTYTPSTMEDDFVVDGQHSYLTPTGFYANGSGDMYNPGTSEYSHDSSIFDISFTLTTESNLLLTGSLVSGSNSYGNYGGGTFFSLYNEDALMYRESTLYINIIPNEYHNPTASLLFESTLGPGNYRAVANTNLESWGGGSGEYEILANFAPAAVPVPAAVWLFGSGLISLVGLARRKKA